MSDEEHFVDEARDRCSRPHPSTRAVLLRREKDTRTGFFDRVDEAPCKAVAILCDIVTAEHLEQGVDGHVARHLTCRCAAHAIAYRERHAARRDETRGLLLVFERSVLVTEVGDHEVVFVVLANEAHVGLAVDAEKEALGRGDERGSGCPAPALHAGLGSEGLTHLVGARPTVTVVVCVAAHSAPDCIRCPT